MTDLWVVGLPILLIDIANPVLLAGIVVGLSAKNPIATSCALVAGHALAYFAFGLLVVFGLAGLVADLLAPLAALLKHSSPWHDIAGAIIGTLLVVVSWRWKINPPDPKKKRLDRIEAGLFPAFLFGALISLAGSPFALPYLAFINRLYGLDDADMVAALGVYNALYALPFLAMPVAFAAFGRSLLPVLTRINEWFDRASEYLIPAVLGLLGLALVLDAALILFVGGGVLPAIHRSPA